MLPKVIDTYKSFIFIKSEQSNYFANSLKSEILEPYQNFVKKEHENLKNIHIKAKKSDMEFSNILETLERVRN